MNITFSSVDNEYIKSQVENGYYSNPTELVRDALRRMREANDKKNDLRAALLIGENQIYNGQTTPLTDELFEQIKQNAIVNSKKGKLINPDVTE